MIIYLSFLYLLFGIIFLLIPLLYIELGRPRDLIKAGLNLSIGMLLLIKQYVFDSFYTLILIVLTILFIFYLVEIFSIRWNQLTNQEKNKLKTMAEFKKNVSMFIEAISLTKKNLFNLKDILKFGAIIEYFNKKKSVINDKNDNIVSPIKNNFLTLEMPKKTTFKFKKDTINEKKNNQNNYLDNK